MRIYREIKKETPWMNEVGQCIEEKVKDVEEFNVIDEYIDKVIKLKDWTAPGVDRIRNYLLHANHLVE